VRLLDAGEQVAHYVPTIHHALGATYSSKPPMPPGLRLDPQSGTISGASINSNPINK
jgi:hypothetical protein